MVLPSMVNTLPPLTLATEDFTYTLGLQHIFSGSAQDTLETLKDILEDLDMVQEQIGGVKVSSTIISKLKNTMSDRHGAEKLFNDLLANYRADILPHVVSGWAEASDSEKQVLTRMNNFFCWSSFHCWSCRVCRSNSEALGGDA